MGTFDSDTPYLSIPSGTVGFYAIEYLDDDEMPRLIPRSREVAGPGWDYERGAEVVWIRGPWAQEADTRTVRMRRYTDDAVLTDDDDTIDLSFEYLVAATKEKLLEASFDRNPSERMLQPRWQKATNEAAFKRGALGRRLMPETVMVR
jgi:hypothetical protein